MQIIPRIRYQDLQSGLSKEQVDEIKKVGTVIITGGIPKEVSVVVRKNVGEMETRSSAFIHPFVFSRRHWVGNRLSEITLPLMLIVLKVCASH